MIDSSTILGLVNNAALLVALGVLYDMIGHRIQDQRPSLQQLGAGLVLGGIGMAVMLTPWQFAPGVLFDTRSVLLSVSGLYFGPIPTLVAVLMTSAFRFYSGGAGAWTGVAVIFTSGAIGVAWRQVRHRQGQEIGLLELYAMGIVVHVAMLLWMLTLPQPLHLDVLSEITVPVMVIHPLGTALLGWLMRNRRARRLSEEALQRRVAELRAFNTMATIVNESLDADEILERAMDEALHLVGVEVAAMMVLDEDSDELVMAAHRGVSDEFVAHFDRMKLGEGLSGQVAQSGKVAVIQNLADYPQAHRAYLERDGIQSAASVPLQGRAGVVGTMTLGAANPEFFDPEGLELLVGVGQQLGIGLEKARLYRALGESEGLNRAMVDNSQDCIKLLDREGALQFMSAGGQALLEIDDIEPYLNQSWLDFWQGEDHESAAMAVKEAAQGGIGRFEGYCPTAKGTPRWWEIIVSPIMDAEGNADRLLAISRDITERKRREAQLRRYEWLQEKEQAEEEPGYTPYYGDVTELNTERRILDGVGREMLRALASDVMDLLDTSVAVYERNGDYAFGMFVSGWCQVMDAASRRLCGTDDNKEALTCGLWHCHENCWHDSAKAAMETGAATDIACVGGIRLYAVPIWANGEVIGAINMGYGDPPTDSETLAPLAELYDLEVEELQRWAKAYRPRPAFIVEAAQRRLRSAARLIGEIVERKRAEAAIQEQLVFTNTLLETIPNPVFHKDTTGAYTGCNAAFCELVGLPEQEIIGKTAQDVSAGDIADQHQERTQEVMRTAQRRTYEGLVQGPSGTFRDVLVNKAPLLDARGKVRGLVGVISDITDLKQLQEELRVHSENLEEMVQARTRALEETQEQLVRQEKLAALGQLAGSVGHELRGPLGVISNAVYYLDTVLSDADEKVKDYLGMISAKVEAATKIISDLLDLGRVKTGDRRPTPVAGLVKEALAHCPAPDGIQTGSELAPDLPPVVVDSRQIEQVLVNLVTNAYQAMPEGGTLTIRGQEEGSMVALSVSDTGLGIAAENLDKIFEPLFTTKARGIGLGLALSQSLVTANGGQISVESAEGQGTTFTLTLPAREGA